MSVAIFSRTKARQGFLAVLCLTGMAGSFGADYYDSTGLTIPMVSVPANNATYTNVKISVKAIGTVLMGTPQGKFDTYTNGNLFIPSAYYAGNQYTNVTVTVGSLLTCCGVATSSSYLIVANPNDKTISTYAYTNNATNGAPVSTVTDQALGNSNPNHQVKLVLDKTNGLIFDVVRLASGGVTVTPFKINLTSGALTVAGPATTYSTAAQVSVDTVNHRAITLYSSGPTATFYPYNTATGAISTASTASEVNALILTVLTLDTDDNLAFALNTTGVLSYSYTASGINFSTPVASAATNLLSYAGTTDNVTLARDQTNKLLLAIAAPSSGSGTKIQAVPYTSGSLGPAGAPVTMNSSNTPCGVDPVRQLLFLGSNTSSNLTVYSYSATGALALSATTDIFNSGLALGSALNGVGGCADVDSVNQIVFYTNNNPMNLTFFLYDQSGVMSSVPAGTISVTQGTQQISILSTNSAR